MSQREPEPVAAPEAASSAASSDTAHGGAQASGVGAGKVAHQRVPRVTSQMRPRRTPAPTNTDGDARASDEAYAFYPSPGVEVDAPRDGAPAADDPFGLHLIGTEAQKPEPRIPAGGDALPPALQTQLEAAAGGDLCGVKVHTGPEAAASAAAEGAHTFTHGGDIVMGAGDAGTPIGELLAHEAAHVAQQRGGAPRIQRKAADGSSEGPDERAADISADRYRLAAESAGNEVDAKTYLRAYLATHIAQAITTAMASRTFELGPARVRWGERGKEFGLELCDQIERLYGGDDHRGLPELLAPSNLWRLVDDNRLITGQGSSVPAMFFPGKEVPSAMRAEPVGPIRWVPDVAVAIRSRLEERILAALPRVVGRYAQVQDEHRAARTGEGPVPPPASGEILPFHPIDRIIVRALCQDGMVTVDEPKDDAAAVEAVAPQRKPRTLKSLQWLSEPGMWNWVKVDPADATAEEVSFHLWKDYSRAHVLTGSAPFFAVPVAHAVEFPQARMQRARQQGGSIFDVVEAGNDSADLTLMRAERDRDPAFDPVAQLARSRVADEASRAQVSRLPEGSGDAAAEAGPAEPTSAGADGPSFGPVLMQLDALRRLVAPIGLDGALADVLQRTEARHAQLASAPAAVARSLGRLASAQHAMLLQIGAPLAQVLSQTRAAERQPGGGPGSASVGAASGLIRAAAHSDLPETARSELAQALVQQRTTATDAMEAMLTDALSRVELLTMNRGEVGAEHKKSAATMHGSLYARQRGLREQVAGLRARFMAGETVAAAEVERVFVQVDALRFEADVLTNLNSMRGVFATVDQMLDSDWVLLAGQGMDLFNVKVGGKKLRDELRIAHQSWMQAFVDLEAGWSQAGSKVVQDPATFAQSRLEPIKARLNRLASDGDVRAYLQKAYEEIDDASTRATIVQIGVYIGVTLVASEVGGAVAVAANAARGAEATAIGGQVVGALTQSALVAGFNAATSSQPGDSFGTLFLSDVIGTMGTLGALGALDETIKGTRMARVLEGLEEASLKARAGYRMLDMTARTLTVGVAQVSQMQVDSVLRTGKSMGADEMLDNGAMGIAMMVTHGVINRLRARPPNHLSRLGAKGEELIRRHAELEAAAVAAEDSPNPELARKFLAQERALYELEALELRRKIDEIGAGDTKLEAQAAGAEAHLSTVASTQGAEIIASSGLAPVVPGHSYTGNAASILDTATRLEGLGYTRHVDDARHGRRIELRTPDRSGVIELVASGPGSPSGDGPVRQARSEPVGPDADAIPSVLPDEPTLRMPAPTPDPGTLWDRFYRPGDERTPYRDVDSTQRVGVPPEVDAAIGSPERMVEVINRTTGVTKDEFHDRVENVTKGPSYGEAMARLRQFYTEMEGEAQAVTPRKGTARDGSFAWDFSHQAQTFSHGLHNVVFRVQLSPTSGIDEARIAQVKQRVQRGVDQYYNFQHETRGPDGVARRLHVEVVFVDDPAAADLQVQLVDGFGVSRVAKWFTGGHPTTDAHEVGHGAFGVRDEYWDPDNLPPGRETPDGERVARDDSLFGFFWADHTLTNVKPGTGLRQRHLDEIGGLAPTEHVRFIERAEATVEISQIPITEQQSPGTTRYFVEDAELERMSRLLRRANPGATILPTETGLLLLRGGEWWHLERASRRAVLDRDHGVAQQQAVADDTRTLLGLPPPNASVVQIYMFPGVETINGTSVQHLTGKDKERFERERARQPLLYYGHAGFSLDGGKTIYGFTPDRASRPDLNDKEFLNLVRSNGAVEGLARDDTHVFDDARRQVDEHGWSTRVIDATQLVDDDFKAGVIDQLGDMLASGGKGAGDGHGKWYMFPYRHPRDGSHFVNECTRNCAMFPQFFGIFVPEPTGLFTNFGPALEGLAKQHPMDLRRSKDQ